MLLKILFLFLFASTILQANNLKQVSLQLEWKHQFQFAGFYIAKEKGFYKEVGIDTTIKELEYGQDPIDEVNDGESTFGLSYPSLVLEKANGKNIVLLSAILQTSPHVLVSLKSSNITSIKEFKDKTIMLNKDSARTASFISMFQANHISINDMNRKDETFNINDLINGNTDIITAFESNELFELDKRKIDYTVWNPKDYGFDFYDVILFTSKNTLHNDSTLVDSFTKASLKGWEYAFKNIEETVTLIQEKYNTQNRTREALLYEANVLKKMAYYKTNKLGVIDKNKIQRIYDIYALMGLVKQKIDLD